MRRFSWIGIAGVIIIASAGCNTDNKTGNSEERYTTGSLSQQRAERGAEIFRDKSFGEVPIACTDCHNDFPDSLLDTRIMPGHSILGAANRRQSWYGEFTGPQFDETAAGASKCALIYQLRGTSLKDALSEDETSSLMEFFKFISTGKESRTPVWETLSYPGDPTFNRDSTLIIVDSLNEINGDAAAGKVLFDRACAFCHSGETNAMAPNPKRLRRYASKVFLYVRVGKLNMPFFSYDKLSDQDVADIRDWIHNGAR